jgi:hypothetical protein
MRQTMTDLSLLSACRHLSSVPPLFCSYPGLCIGVIDDPHSYVHLSIFERLMHDKHLLLGIQQRHTTPTRECEAIQHPLFNAIRTSILCTVMQA